MARKNIAILELFAGVGGFRVGLERADEEFFKTKWSNQWEPSKKTQDAFDCYNFHFPSSENINEDIATISNERFSQMKADMIVGGFPCQDYSVARTLSGEKGIQGKKGVLFWEILRAVESVNPQFLLLENVDRLLKSPTFQRGRDFAIMLAALNNLDYSVEWRVINAADYGMAQRRRRVFIFAYKNDSSFSKMFDNFTLEEMLYKKGLFAREFPVEQKPNKSRIISDNLPSDLVKITSDYSKNFFNAGIMKDGRYLSIDTTPISVSPTTLGEILVDEKSVDSRFYLSQDEIEKLKYLRGSKKINRVSSNGHEYVFSEGAMSETDGLDKPGRTMLTSEGTSNRSTHVIKVNGRLRKLTPIECERLNGFPDNWTEKMNDRMRYFCMGNALVTGINKKIGSQLFSLLNP